MPPVRFASTLLAGTAAACLLFATGPVWSVPTRAGAAEQDTQALLEKTGVKGGLCLVIGAKDTSLAAALAARSALYVHLLQPDAELAAAWGAEFAKSDCQDREKLGVRNAGFDPEHYGSDLFNLIVVQDAAALGKATPTDVCRILVPNGFVAFRTTPESFAADAQKLKMASQPPRPFQAIFRKAVLPVEWKPPISLEWRAGERAHNNSGFTGVTSGDGRFFYRERMEAKGEYAMGRSQLFARDAYNGRTLWTVEEPVGWDPHWYGASQVPNKGLAADNKGRLFAATSDGKFVCLDARTGALVWKNLVPPVERYIGGYEQMESIRPPSLNVAVSDGLAYIDNLVFKPETEERQPAPKKAPGGRHLKSNSGMPFHDLVLVGNSLSRTNEDNKGALFTDGQVSGRVVAFDDALSVAYMAGLAQEDWAAKGGLNLVAAKEPRKTLWKSPNFELVVDDIVLTPQYAYCVGHYQRIAKEPELWVVSREDGKVVNTIPVDGFPAFLGMSAAGNRLFISTREGKLICHETK